MLPGFFDCKRHSLFILLILLIAGSSRAQNTIPSVINTTGNTYSQASITYEWSVGEIALIETMAGSTGSITNGLLQPVFLSKVVLHEPEVFPGNILTANGDGKNDTWVIKGLEKYPDNEVTVYDRAGRIVFKSKNYQNNWSGKVSGLPLAEDTYYFIIQLKKGAQTSPIKGFITILN